MRDAARFILIFRRAKCNPKVLVPQLLVSSAEGKLVSVIKVL
jgi:hypothetical protein